MPAQSYWGLRHAVIRTNDGRDIRVIDEDLEPALLSLKANGRSAGRGPALARLKLLDPF